MQNYLRAQAKLESAWKQVFNGFLERQGCQISFVKSNAESFVSEENYQDLESRLGTTLVTEATMLQRWFPLSIKKKKHFF